MRGKRSRTNMFNVNILFLIMGFSLPVKFSLIVRLLRHVVM